MILLLETKTMARTMNYWKHCISSYVKIRGTKLPGEFSPPIRCHYTQLNAGCPFGQRQIEEILSGNEIKGYFYCFHSEFSRGNLQTDMLDGSVNLIIAETGRRCHFNWSRNQTRSEDISFSLTVYFPMHVNIKKTTSSDLCTGLEK